MGARINKFDYLRKKAEDEANVQTQTQTDALQRRAASLGMTGSGATDKQMRLTADAGAKRLQTAREGIDMLEVEDTSRKEEILEGRRFQTSEREAGQGFQSTMADKAMGFAKSERLGSQEFSRGERLSSQDFASMERKAQELFQAGQNDAARQLQQQALTMQASQFAETMKMAGSQFDLDAYISMQNLITASGKGDRAAITLPPELQKLLGMGEQGVFKPSEQVSTSGSSVVTEKGMPPPRAGESSVEYRRRIMADGWQYQNGTWVKA